MPDAFTDLARVTRSHIPVTNTPAKMDVPNVRRTAFQETRDAKSGDPLVTEIMLSNDIEPRSVDECPHIAD
ncbi:hypothetical protein EV2_019592 [Malus domestica]